MITTKMYTPDRHNTFPMPAITDPLITTAMAKKTKSFLPEAIATTNAKGPDPVLWSSCPIAAGQVLISRTVPRESLDAAPQRSGELSGVDKKFF